MVNYIPKAGNAHVPSYQISSIPYVTSSFAVPPSGTHTPVAVCFPRVTNFVTVYNSVTGSTSAPLRVGFSENGVNAAEGNHNYYVLDNGESYTGTWRVERIYLLADKSNLACSASIIAGLTPIETGSIPGMVAGAGNWSGSIGVG